MPMMLYCTVRAKYRQIMYCVIWENECKLVAYKLTREMVEGSAVRKNDFREDPNVKTGSAKLIDYKGSGYDRGHLCPASAMCINDQAMSESFFMSNVSPQVPALNRGKWKSLEIKVRQLTVENDSLYVITGPVFHHNKGAILKILGTSKDTFQLINNVIFVT